MADSPQLFRFRHTAMATCFEVIIPDSDADAAYASQASQAVFNEIDRLEDELSRYRPMSDVARIRQLKSGETTVIGLATLDCLALAKSVHQESCGAFDITIGPLMKLYRDETDAPRIPHHEEEAQALARVGLNLLELDEDTNSVKVNASHMIIDLGAVGKGYALDQCADVLADWKIANALLNAGDSTVIGIGAAPDQSGWTVTAGNREKIAIVLQNNALSGSGFHVKGAHIINPRTMRPAPPKSDRTWALAPTAALSDALSTAFMLMTREEIDALCARHPSVQAFLD